MDQTKELPKGFYDYTDDAAIAREQVFCSFKSIGMRFGLQLFEPSVIGYEETYQCMGNAVENRCYPFRDRAGRHLMLSADSLATSIRVYRKQAEKEGYGAKRLFGKVPVFRHRHKPLRNWNQLVVTLFNEADPLYAYYILVYSAHEFVKTYYSDVEYILQFFSIFEKVFELYNITRDDGYLALYEIYVKNITTASTQVHQHIFRIQKLCKGLQIHEQMEALQNAYPFLVDTICEINDFLIILDELQISYRAEWEQFSSVEHFSGIQFRILDKRSNYRIVEGGSFQYVAHKIDSGIKNCYSFASGVEIIAEQVKAEVPAPLYLIKADCSIRFFIRLCNALRRENMFFVDLVQEKKIHAVIKSLPPHSQFVIVGKKEEECGIVIANGREFIIKPSIGFKSGEV